MFETLVDNFYHWEIDPKSKIQITFHIQFNNGEMNFI